MFVKFCVIIDSNVVMKYRVRGIIVDFQKNAEEPLKLYQNNKFCLLHWLPLLDFS